MKRNIKQIIPWSKRLKDSFNFNGTGWRGAAWGLAVLSFLIVAALSYGLFGYAGFGRWLIGFCGFTLLSVFMGVLLTGLLKLIAKVPSRYLRILLALLPGVAFMGLIASSIAIGILGSVFVAGLVFSLFGAAFALLYQRDKLKLKKSIYIFFSVIESVTFILLSVIFIMFCSHGFHPYAESPTAFDGQVLPSTELADPSAPGSYEVGMLCYGSSEEIQQTKYGDCASLMTVPVDGTGLIDKWGNLRARYWGFGLDALPINGRVWYPQGEGQFPLVLIVHGQHMMEENSDEGYAYLGELLASRGLITVSVDENFINMSPFIDLLILNGLKDEIDLRGWLLLKHLDVWEEWNQEPGHSFYDKVDLDHIALVGHSRGGEAVAAAAALNQLSHHPDDGAIEFDFGHHIESVISIAPVDGQFLPREENMPLSDVNYLVLQGAQDMDVFSYSGLKMFERLDLAEDSDQFKAGVYIKGANHGQFNRVWGRKDLLEPIMRLFDLSQLMPAEDQEQIARVFISAFLETTLNGAEEYEVIFQDYRTAQEWLPRTDYISQYQSAHMVMIADYEEDIDLTSGTLADASLHAENFTLWNEQPLRAKYQTLQDQAVYFGWDSSFQSGLPVYVVDLSESAIELEQTGAIVFSIAQIPENPVPDQKWSPKELTALDLRIVMVDETGESGTILLSDLLPLTMPIEGHLGKQDFMSPFAQSEEIVQYYQIPLTAFLDQNSALTITKVDQIQFVFDQTTSGMVAIDDIGYLP